MMVFLLTRSMNEKELSEKISKIKEEYQKMSKIYQESKINNNIPLN